MGNAFGIRDAGAAISRPPGPGCKAVRRPHGPCLPLVPKEPARERCQWQIQRLQRSGRSRDGGDQSLQGLEAYNPSVSLRLTAPFTQGSLPAQTTSPKPLLEERWHAKRDGEVCRRVAAAARQRPLHRSGPCGKSLVRQHLSSGAGWRILRGFAPRNFGLRRHSKNSSISHGYAMTAPLEGSLPSQASGLDRLPVVRPTRRCGTGMIAAPTA